MLDNKACFNNPPPDLDLKGRVMMLRQLTGDSGRHNNNNNSKRKKISSASVS